MVPKGNKKTTSTASSTTVARSVVGAPAVMFFRYRRPDTTPVKFSMGTIDLLTPVHAAGAQFLPELYASIQSQRLPAGWSLRWIVQEDGDTPQISETVRSLAGKDPRVLYGANGRQGGPAVTRTQAFHAGCGEVVLGIDADDVLEPDGLAAVIEAFQAHPKAAWVTGRTFEFSADGHRKIRSSLIPTGPLPAGRALELWDTTGLSTPWYPTATAYRRWAVLLMGGWPAAVGGEDIELLACVAAAWGGMIIDEPLMARRLWDGQITRTDPVIKVADRVRANRHARATLIDGWRRAGLLGTPVED